MSPAEALANYARNLDAAFVQFTREHTGDFVERHELSHPAAMLACAVRNREMGARAAEISQSAPSCSSNVIALPVRRGA
ncbi:hypothetical protein UFOVP1204_55 [uncultured Caudovirales phage]|uniref:Uncharacterized protein n=1 Tax=uncultured Caudovirales phage TaxID=2100421 RepID=A0A6J5PXL6_9CAUD|nr:hypothetical protein UFOVP473_46 [uncultured Caudovirales phage]CAB4176693.1 hypothetical protein UFOVP983_46 [uncultured Caudovirales phage]CAB4190247.1 hypothetical protein UFOVP1204_55 [uncultured Caudovirales phage]